MSMKGFYAQEEEKRKGGEEREEMGKNNISEGTEQIKGVLLPKTTKSGYNHYLAIES